MVLCSAIWAYDRMQGSEGTSTCIVKRILNIFINEYNMVCISVVGTVDRFDLFIL